MLPTGKWLQVGSGTNVPNPSGSAVERDKDEGYEEIVRSSCLFAS
jgi:hypothetical protein